MIDNQPQQVVSKNKKKKNTYAQQKAIAQTVQDLPHRNIDQVIKLNQEHKLDKVLQKLDQFSTQSLKQYARQKTGLSASQLAEQSLEKGFMGQNRLFLELVACDDWSTIAQWALPYISKYGMQGIKWLWDQYVNPRLQKKITKRSLGENQFRNLAVRNMGPQHDDYANPIQPTQNATVFNPYTYAEVANPQGWGRSTTTQAGLHLNAIDKDFIKCFLSPDKYVYRRPTDKITSTALAIARTQQILTTDANGNVAFYIFPQQLFSGSVASEAANNVRFTSMSLTGLVPATGVYTTQNALLGPLGPTQPSISQWRLNTGRIVFTPITSINNSQGNVQLVYFQDAPNSTFNTSGPAPVLSQQQMQSMPFYQSSNMLSSISSNRLMTTDANDDQFDAPASGSYPDGTPMCTEGWYILITGAAPNTNVAKVDIYLSGEFIPTQASIPICVTEKPQNGTQTVKCISNLIAQNRQLQCLKDNDLAKAVQLLDNCKPNFDSVIDQFSGFSVNYSNSSLNPVGGVDIGSMEILN